MRLRVCHRGGLALIGGVRGCVLVQWGLVHEEETNASGSNHENL